jgi:hypothetical protein
MAKHKVGVLEASASPESTAPETFCGRAIAEYLVNEHFARKIGKRLIHMVKLTAAEAIELAKRAREAAAMLWERQRCASGSGTSCPSPAAPIPTITSITKFPTRPGLGFFPRARMQARERCIKVSARPRQSTFMPATAAPTSAMRLADAFPS